MLQTKFQAPEPSSSGEEEFLVYFIFEPKSPRCRVSLDPRVTIRTKLLKVFESMLQMKFEASGPCASEEEN